jgi:hypothetical protein
MDEKREKIEMKVGGRTLNQRNRKRSPQQLTALGAARKVLMEGLGPSIPLGGGTEIQMHESHLPFSLMAEIVATYLEKRRQAVADLHGEIVGLIYDDEVLDLRGDG